MRIQNIAGATAVLEHNGVRILFDPWMDEGIFHGAWYHYPPSKVSLEDLGRIDFIYISHIHEDHCSPGTLSKLNNDAEIIILDRKPNLVAKFLDNHKFKFKKIHLVQARKPKEILSNLSIDMIEGDPANPMAHAIDSTLILKWDDYIIVNANDCLPYKDGMDYILGHYQKIDIALIPYAGGSGYPSCYLNLTDEEKELERNRIIENKLEAFLYNANYLKPNYVMPFADQYVVSGSRSHLDQFIAHPHSPGVVEEYVRDKVFLSKLLLLNSGQAFDFERGQKLPPDSFCHTTREDRRVYLQKIISQKYDHEHFNLNPSVALHRLVSYARERLWKVQNEKGFKLEFQFYLDAVDLERRFKIDLASDLVEEVSIHCKCVEPYLRISVTGTLLMLLLIGHISWNIADAALFIDYERRPNVYDARIYEFLNYLKA
ncbi:MAG: MBL fold metallo-hydrolase [Gammaproteobacteria bacterium]